MGGVLAVSAVFAAAVGVVGSVGVAASRAQGAADAAALGGAAIARDLLAMGQAPGARGERPCVEALMVVERWGGLAARCILDADGSVEVEVTTSVAGVTVTRSSRAGRAG